MYFLSEPKFETNFGERPVRQRAAGWLADGQDEQAASSAFHPTFDISFEEKFCMSSPMSVSDITLIYDIIKKR